MTDYAALYQEIQEPQYEGMDDQQISDAINAEMVTVKLAPAPADSGALYNAVTMPEFDALDDTAHQRVTNLMMLPGSVDIAEGTTARGVLDAAFPSGTDTNTNVVNLTTQTMTRAAQMGFVEVTPSEIAAARIYGVPSDG